MRHLGAAVLLGLAGCSAGLDYVRPTAAAPPAFKELAGWKLAAPADGTDRGQWWRRFNDPVLDGLIAEVEVSNQNLATAAANYAQARALVRESRAAYFPVLTGNGSVTRTRSSSSQRDTVELDPDGVPVEENNRQRDRTQYRVDIGASWEPDLWGRIRRSVEANRAASDASAADLANARLSAQGELAIAYLQLRAADAEAALIDASVAAYARALAITQNRYAAGVAARVDVLQAQSQLDTARADGADLVRQRGVLEHAVAVLVGRAPSEFTIARSKWTPVTPAVPVGVPSTLLERRPDVAAAERRVAAANAGIGIEQAAYFPSIVLDGSIGLAATGVGGLFNAGAEAWSLGASLLQTIFDGGTRRARVAGARAAYDGTVAAYRQTVLVAINQVEDQLVTGRILEQQNALRGNAADAASQTEAIVLNQYLAGQVAYTDVVVAQNSALTARRAVLAVVRDRQTTAVALAQALGGDYTAS